MKKTGVRLGARGGAGALAGAWCVSAAAALASSAGVASGQDAFLSDALPERFEFTSKIPVSPDSRVIYVSSSLGDDRNDGETVMTPVRTLERGYDLLRDGYPDQLRLRAGDTWVGERFTGNWQKSGRSAAEPLVVMPYGPTDAPRPKLIAEPGQPFIQATRKEYRQHIVFIGLHAEAHPSDRKEGVRWLAPVTNLVFEDFLVEGFEENISIAPPKGTEANGVKVRGCVLIDAHSGGSGHSQGFYASRVNGLELEGNVFDHNGWNASPNVGKPTIFNHNAYLQGTNGTVKVWNNIFARASSHGVQARPGGLVSRNLFVDNSIAAFVANGAGSEMIGNVVLGAKDIDGDELRGVGLQTLSVESAVVARNIIAHKDPSVGAGGALEISLSNADVAKTDVEAFDNIMFNWPGWDIQIPEGNVSRFGEVRVHNNTVVVAGQDDPFPLWYRAKEFPSRFYFGENTYGMNPGDIRFRIRGGEHPLSEWEAVSGQTPTIVARDEVPFGDPYRTVERYMGEVMGDAATKAAFFEAIRGQSKRTYDPALEASAIISWVRAGFEYSN